MATASDPKGLGEQPRSFEQETNAKARTARAGRNGAGPIPANLEELPQGDAATLGDSAWNIGNEMITFWHRRVHANLAHYQTLLGCRTSMDMLEANRDFTERLLTDYAEGARAAGERGVTIIRQTWLMDGGNGI